MEQKYRGYDIAIDAPECFALVVAHTHQAEDERQHQYQHYNCSHKTELLAYGAEDEVGMFLGHQAVADMRALQVALAKETSRTDSDLRLANIIVE